MRRKLRAKLRTKRPKRLPRTRSRRIKLRRRPRTGVSRRLRSRRKGGKRKLRRVHKRFKGRAMKARRRTKKHAARRPGYTGPDSARISVLRERGAVHWGSLQQHDRVALILHSMLRLEPEDYIWQLHRQLLNREPSLEELRYHMAELGRGVTKLDVLDRMIRHDETGASLTRIPDAGAGDDRSLAGLFRTFIHASPAAFLFGLYSHLLGRYPDPAGAANNLKLLAEGAPRGAIIAGFLQAPESRQFLQASEPRTQLVHPAGGAAVHIGLFLGFTTHVSLTGEGIGRFVFRLAKGLLANNPDTVLYVAAMHFNMEEARQLTGSMESDYPGRFFILPIPSMDWVNAHIPVDKWIVPYLGMELALQLQKPVVLCLHDMVHKHFPAEYYAADPEFCTRVDRIGIPLAQKASAVVFSSEFTRRHEGLQFLGLPYGKTRVIRLAPPTEEYLSLGIIDEQTFRQSYGLLDPYLVYPSVVRLHKNHDRLVEAFLAYKMSPAGQSSRLQLVMTDEADKVNRHTWGILHRIKSMLDACPDPNARSSVRFIGRLPTHHLPSLYKYAFGTMVPTLFEGSCPFPILESLLMDTPVAAGNLEVTREVIPAMSAFVTFDPYSAGAIHSAIHELVAYNHSLLPAEKAAVKDALSRNWSDVAQEYYHLIRTL